MGSFFFQNTNVHRGVLPLRKWTSKGEGDGEGGPKKAILCERNN